MSEASALRSTSPNRLPRFSGADAEDNLGSTASGRAVRRYLEDGDDAAFDKLYRHHAPQLRRRLKRKWGLSDYAVEDTLQETFLQGFHALRKINDIDKIGAWLTTIADRQAIATRWTGSESTRSEVPSGAPADLESQARSMAENDHTGSVVDEMVFRAAMDALPPSFREVVKYSMEGLTFAEIGQVMGCSPSAAHNLLSAARDRLAGQLAVFQPLQAPVPPPVRLSTRYRQAMLRLTFRRREVLERHIYRGMKPVEIAAELNISPDCARVHLHLAYKQLARLLDITDYKIVINLLKPSRQPR